MIFEEVIEFSKVFVQKKGCVMIKAKKCTS